MAADFKTRLYEILEGVRARDPVAKISEILLVSLIAANVAAVVLETVPDLVTDYQRFFEVFETISVVIFTVEYLGRLWTSTEQPGRQDQAPWSTRLRYMLTPMALIDLIAILPFYLSVFMTLDLRFMRVFRLLRLLKLSRYSPALATVGVVFHAQRRSLTAGLMDHAGHPRLRVQHRLSAGTRGAAGRVRGASRTPCGGVSRR